MSYKTLIIIDNTDTLTTLNQEIVKATVKYFISHIDKEDKVALAVTGETAEYISDFDDSVNTQLKMLDSIEFTETNAPATDVLMEVVLNWKQGDLALRDIVYISSRCIGGQSEYSEEELLFEVNTKLYPIYTIACSQNENTAALKSLNSLSRISGGESISTDDAVSDAEVEKQLSEKLLNAMKEKRRQEQERYEKEIKETEEAKETDSEEDYDEYYSQNTEEDESAYEEYEYEDYYGDEETGSTIYELPDEYAENHTTDNIKYPIIAVASILIIIVTGYSIKSRKNKKENERFHNSLKKTSDMVVDKKERLPFEGGQDQDTVCLSDLFDNADTGTRLLYQTKEGIEITLEDRADPTKYYRACVRDTVVIGRNSKVCDIAITHDDSISSRHCELCLRDNSLYCRDLGSSNGTMINQQKVYQEIKIESGDILRIGRLSFFIQIVGENYE